MLWNRVFHVELVSAMRRGEPTARRRSTPHDYRLTVCGFHGMGSAQSLSAMPRSPARDVRIPLYLDQLRASHAADVLKALAHPIRLRLVALLCKGNHNVSELTSVLALKQSIVSQQLAILRRERLVATVRVKGMAVYHVAEPQMHDMVRCLERCASWSSGQTSLEHVRDAPR